MNFEKLAEERYSSRRYDSEKQIETDKLKRILTTAAKAPSACNGQPYHITVVSKDMAKKVARVTKDARINSGDTVFIKKADTVNNGEIAAIIINDEATLKRVYYYPESSKLMLISENSNYEPLVFAGEELDRIRIIGKAVAFKSEIR